MPIELVRPDWDTLEAEWRTLEEAADCSFFQSWTWIGCRAQARFTDPWLLRATPDAPGTNRAPAGLALFNRTGPRWAPTLRLHETGRPGEDSVFIEHNAPLLARGQQALLRPMLQAALRHGRLVLGGVGDAVLAAARAIGACHVTATRTAPFADLSGDQATWLAGLGASTRSQLRRSRRRYEAAGRLVVDQATGISEALAFLAGLAALHQARWSSRGRSGAFADPAFAAFHRALVARGLPRGEVELLRVSTAGRPVQPVVGYLYNLRWRDRVHAYQGGFDYAAAGPRQSPGLTCHEAAIAAASAAGVRTYDFLAGEARYKSSLGHRQTAMHWIELAARGSPYGVLHRLRASARRWAAEP